MTIFLLIFIHSALIIHGDAYGFIGIFSAPQNFLQRHTIRTTWGKETRLDNNIAYKFFIGSKQCQIPVESRANIYECLETSNVQKNSSFSSVDYLLKRRAAHCASGFGFLANQNFYITHIGILRQFIDLYEFPVRVKLRDALNGRQLSSVTFYDKKMCLKAIGPVYFPRGSEGILVLDQKPSTFCSPLTFNNTKGPLTISSIVNKNLVVPVEPHHGLSIFFNGRSDDEKAATDENKNLNILVTEESLREEQDRFGDVLFINVTDVYRNLPLKLIKFFEKINSYNFSYVIKTDDDSVLDIKRIEYSLRHASRQKMWWWSTFKEFWAVPRFGKWRETVFKSITYPPFPCGGGYVVSKEVVEYITNMKDNLRLFQGEDVSMGIWLSGLQINYYSPKNELYQAFSYRAIMRQQCEDVCSWTCDEANSNKPTCNLVQLSPTKIIQKWQMYLNNGYL